MSSRTSLAAALAILLLAPAARASSGAAVVAAASTLTPAASPRSRKNVKRGGGTTKKKTARGGALTVPIDVGIGPIGLMGLNDLSADQVMHAGLAISIAAVLDRQLIEQNMDRVPRQYRDQLRNTDSLTVRPLWLGLIPETIVVSPPLWNTGVYGAVWRPIGFGTSVGAGPTSVGVGAKIALSYLYLHSTTLPQPTHFLRPGINLYFSWLIPFTKVFLVSTGWSSDFYLPQPLGEPPWSFWPLDHALWHLGGPFIKLHFRIPYTVTL